MSFWGELGLDAPVSEVAPSSSKPSARAIAFPPLYWIFLFFSLWLLNTYTKRDFSFYFLSDLLNSSSDTPYMFAIRWSGWTMYVLTCWPFFHAWLGKDKYFSPAIVWTFGMAAVTLTGFQIKIFDETANWGEAASWAHNVGSAISFLCAGFVIWSAGWRVASGIWTFGAVLYCALYILNYLDSIVFKVWENVGFWTMHAAMIWSASSKLKL